MGPAERSKRIKALALEAGFDQAGIVAAEALPEEETARLDRWLAEGRHGTMAYMARGAARRKDPGAVLPGVRSILCVSLNYGGGTGDGVGAGDRPTGRVAAYARGRDYHKVFLARFRNLEARLAREFPGVSTRRYVDTGPVMEKLWAERAGLGWRGKHTNLLSRDWGSWLLLGEILLDLDLEPDRPARDHCGECTRCMDACPTGAITGPYRLDARLCISYLTIEHRGSIPKDLREPMGDRVFGCDECLDVCPWNRFARASGETELAPREGVDAPLLTDLVGLDETGFRERFAGTAIMRAKREGLVRNACVALGNVGGPGAVEALEGAAGDGSPVVREHAAWALGRIGDAAAREVLRRRREVERDPEVLATIREALAGQGSRAVTPPRR